jgi:hypothetical protein
MCLVLQTEHNFTLTDPRRKDAVSQVSAAGLLPLLVLGIVMYYLWDHLTCLAAVLIYLNLVHI